MSPAFGIRSEMSLDNVSCGNLMRSVPGNRCKNEIPWMLFFGFSVGYSWKSEKNNIVRNRIFVSFYGYLISLNHRPPTGSELFMFQVPSSFKILAPLIYGPSRRKPHPLTIHASTAPVELQMYTNCGLTSLSVTAKTGELQYYSD